MEGGSIVESGGGAPKQITWIEGAPEMSIWGYMKTKGRQRLKLYGWRCPNCSLVRIYAPEEEE